MKGDIRVIKEQNCSNPTGTPIYPEDEKEKKDETAMDEKNKKKKKSPRWKDFVASRYELVEPPAVDVGTCGSSGDPTLDHLGDPNKSMLEEMEKLQQLEQELALMIEIQEQQELLEALEHEEIMLDVNRVCGSEEAVESIAQELSEQDSMIKKLVSMQFPEEIASWSVQTSKGDWETALDKARKRFQEKAEQVQTRPPATPCTSTRLPNEIAEDTKNGN